MPPPFYWQSPHQKKKVSVKKEPVWHISSSKDLQDFIDQPLLVKLCHIFAQDTTTFKLVASHHQIESPHANLKMVLIGNSLKRQNLKKPNIELLWLVQLGISWARFFNEREWIIFENFFGSTSVRAHFVILIQIATCVFPETELPPRQGTETAGSLNTTTNTRILKYHHQPNMKNDASNCI